MAEEDIASLEHELQLEVDRNALGMGEMRARRLVELGRSQQIKNIYLEAQRAHFLTTERLARRTIQLEEYRPRQGFEEEKIALLITVIAEEEEPISNPFGLSQEVKEETVVTDIDHDSDSDNDSTIARRCRDRANQRGVLSAAVAQNQHHRRGRKRPRTPSTRQQHHTWWHVFARYWIEQEIERYHIWVDEYDALTTLVASCYLERSKAQVQIFIAEEIMPHYTTNAISSCRERLQNELQEQQRVDYFIPPNRMTLFALPEYYSAPFAVEYVCAHTRINQKGGPRVTACAIMWQLGVRDLKDIIALTTAAERTMHRSIRRLGNVRFTHPSFGEKGLRVLHCALAYKVQMESCINGLV